MNYLQNHLSMARLCLDLHRDKPNVQNYRSGISEVIFKCQIKYISKVCKTFKAIIKEHEIIYQWAACCAQKQQILSCNSFSSPSDSNERNILFAYFIFCKVFSKMQTHRNIQLGAAQFLAWR